MARNTALITDAAQADARQTLDDYAAGVAAHIGGDWAGHLQMQLHSSGYSCNAGNVSTLLFRMLLTDTVTDAAVTCPAFLVGPVAATSLPIIGLQPQSLTVAQGGSYQLTVYAASELPLSYQWQLNGVNILNAIQSVLIIPVAVKPTTGTLSYTVIVRNQNGTVLSNAAVVTVV